MAKAKKKKKKKRKAPAVPVVAEPEHRQEWIGGAKGALVVVFLGAVGGFCWDYFTTDPEHTQTKQIVSSQGRLIDALTGNVAKLTVIADQNVDSIKSLSIDRAVPKLETALLAIARLEERGRAGWTVNDTERYNAWIVQRDDARRRLR